MSFLDFFGWWKPKPPLPNPVQDWWEMFAVGNEVTYFGNEAVITAMDDYVEDDGGEYIPEMSLSYKDAGGKVHHEILFPHDVWCMVVHKDGHGQE